MRVMVCLTLVVCLLIAAVALLEPYFTFMASILLPGDKVVPFGLAGALYAVLVLVLTAGITLLTLTPPKTEAEVFQEFMNGGGFRRPKVLRTLPVKQLTSREIQARIRRSRKR